MSLSHSARRRRHDLIPPNKGKTLIESLPKAQRAVAAKDISWLWRTAYNCAVQGCADWEAAEDAVTKLFDTAREVCLLFQLAASLAHADGYPAP